MQSPPAACLAEDFDQRRLGLCVRVEGVEIAAVRSDVPGGTIGQARVAIGVIPTVMQRYPVRASMVCRTGAEQTKQDAPQHVEAGLENFSRLANVASNHGADVDAGMDAVNHAGHLSKDRQRRRPRYLFTSWLVANDRKSNRNKKLKKY